MAEAISGIISQQLQQAQINPVSKQSAAQPPSGKSFEAHLQDKAKGSDQIKTDKPNIEPPKTIEQIQAELQKATVQKPESDPAKMTQLLREIMGDSGGRMSMLKSAYDKLGRTNAVPSDLKGNLINTENEWKAVQQIMNSDKNLTQGELLALQQRLYMVSQHVEVMSKVVDQMAGGIKTVLNTNI